MFCYSDIDCTEKPMRLTISNPEFILALHSEKIHITRSGKTAWLETRAKQERKIVVK